MDIQIKETDDWIAVYKDGIAVWQNHDCPIKQALRALGIEYGYEWVDDISDVGRFPERLGD